MTTNGIIKKHLVTQSVQTHELVEPGHSWKEEDQKKDAPEDSKSGVMLSWIPSPILFP